MAGQRTRPKQIKFWTTEEEYDNIKERVSQSKLTQNEYLIRSAMENDIVVIDGLKDTLLELSTIGNSLNELGNTKKISQEDFNEVKDGLLSVWKHIERILSESNKRQV